MRKILLTLLTILLLTMPVCAGQSEGVRVAVIDTGISTAAIDPARIDGGINYIRPQDGTEDKLGHGTAVSAIIVGSEPARIEGICPTATLVPMIFATKDEEGKQVRGDTAMVAQAIYDAVNVYHCRIINISSGSQNGSHRLQQAVEYAEEAVGYHNCFPWGYETKYFDTPFESAIDHILVLGEPEGAVRRFERYSPDYYFPISDHSPAYIDLEL